MKLLDEDAKMWYWSTATLYDMLEEEKHYKRRTKLSGKKLMFMGSEIGQFREWDYEGEIEWFLLVYVRHTMKNN